MQKHELNRIPVVITTSLRGAYFGYVDPEDMEKRPTVTAYRLRHIFSWASEVGGLYGLASKGPLRGSRVTETPVEQMSIGSVANIFKVSPGACEVFEAAGWNT